MSFQGRWIEYWAQPLDFLAPIYIIPFLSVDHGYRPLRSSACILARTIPRAWSSATGLSSLFLCRLFIASWVSATGISRFPVFFVFRLFTPSWSPIFTLSARLLFCFSCLVLPFPRFSSALT